MPRPRPGSLTIALGFVALTGCGGGTPAPAADPEPVAAEPTALFADAESVAEEGLGVVLREGAEVFASIGVDLAIEGDAYRLSRGEASVTITETLGEDAIAIAVGERAFRIELSGEPDWEAATLVALAALDHALAAIGANERAYALYFGGNEQSFVFMAPADRARRDADVASEERLTAAD